MFCPERNISFACPDITLLSCKLVLPLLLLLTPFYPGRAESKNSTDEAIGKDLFEQAYQLETKDREKAIELYRKAIDSGLDSNLKKAAHWKLFYIYKYNKDYIPALNELSQLGDPKKLTRIISALHREIKNNWKIDQVAWQHYLNGFELINKPVRTTAENKGANKREYSSVTDTNSINNSAMKNEIKLKEQFEQAILAAPDNKLFQDMIIRTLTINGYENIAIHFISGSSEMTTLQQLIQARRLIDENNFEVAKKSLINLATINPSISSKNKSRLLYLLAKIYAAQSNEQAAVRFYRLSARYADEKVKIHRLAAASYLLYKNNLPLQALSLLRGIEPDSDFNIRFLFTVLKAEVDNNPEALSKLKNMRPTLLESKQVKLDPFLTDRALSVLSKMNLQ